MYNRETEEKEEIMKKATSKQITEVAEFLVDRYFKDAYRLLTPEQKLKIPKDIHDKIFGPSIDETDEYHPAQDPQEAQFGKRHHDRILFGQRTSRG